MLNSFPLAHVKLDSSLLIQGSRIAVGLFSPWVNTNLYKSEAESSFGSYLQSFRKLGRYWEKLMGRWDRSRNEASVEIRPKPDHSSPAPFHSRRPNFQFHFGCETIRGLSADGARLIPFGREELWGWKLVAELMLCLRHISRVSISKLFT